MVNFDSDPVNLYRNLKEKIPLIKNKNCKAMNRLHKLNMPSEFWWAISGEYALLSEYLSYYSIKDPNLLNNLSYDNREFPPAKMVSSLFIRIIGQNNINDKNILTSRDKINKKIEELLVNDVENHFNINSKKNSIEVFSSFKIFTNFLNQLRLKKFKSFFLKIQKKYKSSFPNSSYINNIQTIDNNDKNFDKIFNWILPNYLNEYFPKWFVWIAEFLVSSKHKWVTKFGYGRNIYQIILMAKSYEKYGDKNIQMIGHGSNFHISFFHLFRFSLFPNLKLIPFNKNILLSKFDKPETSEDILFCPAQFPFVHDFFSIDHYRNFIQVYKQTINLLNDAYKNGLKIKIRYKNFKHTSGYFGPLIFEESQIPIENENFEDVYYKYKLIIVMPFGTISEKCYFNNVSCITYNYPYYLTDKKTYLKVNSYPGVFKEGNKFLKEIENKIKSFL